MCNPMITQPKNSIFRSKHSKQVSTCDIHWHLMTCFRIPNLINGISPSPASKELVLPVQHVDQLLGFLGIAMMLQLLDHDPTMTQPGPRTGQNAPADSNYMELVPSQKILGPQWPQYDPPFFGAVVKCKTTGSFSAPAETVHVKASSGCVLRPNSPQFRV